MKLAGPNKGMKTSKPQARTDNRKVTSEDGLDIVLFPEEVRFDLRPAPEGITPERLGAMWHDKPPGTIAHVTLRNRSSASKVILLYADGPSYGIAQSWIRWSFDQVESREFRGGSAFAAQDRRFTRVQAGILFFPGQPNSEVTYPDREAELLFAPILDGAVEPHDYEFRVIAVDVTDCQARTGDDIDQWIRRLDAADHPFRELRKFASRFPSLTAVGNLRLRHPKSELLDSLPSLYREALDEVQSLSENPSEPTFFERFLLGFEDMFRPLEHTISCLERLFGPYSVAPEHLLNLAAQIVERNNPMFVENDHSPCGVDGNAWRLGPQQYLGKNSLGQDRAVLGDIDPYTFFVTIAMPSGFVDEESKFYRAVERVIDSYKPAYTTYQLRIVDL